MKTIIDAAFRRQRILNVLHEHGPLMLAEIAALVGESNAQCGSDLNTGRVRREVVLIPGTHKRNGRWKAMTRTASYSDPKDYVKAARAKTHERLQDASKEKSVPGLRVVRLLDKKNHVQGGQCANIRRGHIQSSIHGGGIAL